jgi:gamma-glutamyltranspeptidase/glutathione hydrolase
MKWAEYFQPAIRVAEQGFTMYSFLYAEMSDASLGRLSAHPSGRDEYLPDGYVPPVGSTVRRPNLARTLRRLAAEGPDGFYRGEWARRFVDAVNATGGSMTMDDLAGYRVRWEEPVRTAFRGDEIVSAPPPSNGGPLIASILGLAEQFDLASLPHYAESGATLGLMRRIFAAAESDVLLHVRDPQSARVPLDVLLSKPYLQARAALVRGSAPLEGPAGGTGAAKSADVDQASPRDWLSCDTNHLVIADPQGNIVSVTHTVYGSTFATGLVVDGVGVNSGNEFPGTDKGPGRRVVSPFPATMVLRDGKPWLALGSPGLSSRAVSIVLTNLLGFRKDLPASVDAPRFQGSLPSDTFLVESRVGEAARAAVAAQGVRVQPTAGYNWHFGSVHAVMRDDKTGGWIGVADPRRAGYASGF